MTRPLFLVGLFLFFFTLSGFAQSTSIEFSEGDRVLIVAPHPDDEALGAGGLIQSAVDSGADVKVVYLTHGDHNEIASIFYQKRPLLTKSDFVRSGQVRRPDRGVFYGSLQSSNDADSVIAHRS